MWYVKRKTKGICVEMSIYWLVFVLTHVMNMFGTYMNKKYQLQAGTGMLAVSVYMVINGIVSAVVAVLAMVAQGAKLEWTWYSVLCAFLTVTAAAVATACSMKVYEKGQITVVSVFTSIGGILISCAYGIVFLKERLLGGQAIAVVLMFAAVLVVILQKNMKIQKGIIGLLLISLCCNSVLSIVSKQHQVEQTFATVNTLSYSLWIGIVRTAMFSVILWVLMKKRGMKKVQVSAPAISSAVVTSVLSGTAYIATLITAVVLPLTITSPFGTALNISLTTIMARVAYREKISKRQLAGLILCIVGIFLFAWL